MSGSSTLLLYRIFLLHRNFIFNRCSHCCGCAREQVGCKDPNHWMERDCFDTGSRNHMQRHLEDWGLSGTLSLSLSLSLSRARTSSLPPNTHGQLLSHAPVPRISKSIISISVAHVVIYMHVCMYVCMYVCMHARRHSVYLP